MVVLNLMFGMMQMANSYGFKAFLSSEQKGELIHSTLSIPVFINSQNRVELIVKYKETPPKDFAKRVYLEENFLPDKSYRNNLFIYELRCLGENDFISKFDIGHFWNGHWMGHVMKDLPHVLVVNEQYSVAAFKWAMERAKAIFETQVN